MRADQLIVDLVPELTLHHRRPTTGSSAFATGCAEPLPTGIRTIYRCIHTRNIR